jgi:hypothetical protein
MSYFGSSPWADAGNYGQAMGQTLAQSMLGVPQQRYENMMQLKQMQAQQQQRQMMGLLAQQKQQELGQYRQGLLEQRGSANELANQWRMFQAQNMADREKDRMNRPMIVPKGASVLTPEQNTGATTNGALQTTPPNPQGLPDGSTNQPPSFVPSIPGYQMTTPNQSLVSPPMNEFQKMEGILKGLDLFGKFSAGTNATPSQMWGQNVASNLVQSLRAPQMMGQPATVMPTNQPTMRGGFNTNTNDPLNLFGGQ